MGKARTQLEHGFQAWSAETIPRAGTARMRERSRAPHPAQGAAGTFVYA